MEQDTNGKNKLHLISLSKKSTKPFLIYLLVVVLGSTPIYYAVVDALWTEEADEFNMKIARQTEKNIAGLSLSDAELNTRINDWNKIQSNIQLRSIRNSKATNDKVFTRYQKKGDDIERLRVLTTTINLNGHPYEITIDSSIGETDETIANIAFISAGFLLLLLVGLLVLAKRTSNRIWRPFNDTLKKLQNFDLRKNTGINFPETDTKEFYHLNTAVEKLINHSVSTYRAQKEFTENASHEMQTPLAVIKNKLDLLLQDENLTLRQYQLVEDINIALLRSSHLNKSLLLLAKIDNRQFEENEWVDLSELLLTRTESWAEDFHQKDITPDLKIEPAVRLKGNRMLLELLTDNLLLNSIRNTSRQGQIQIRLSYDEMEVANSGSEALNVDLLFQRFSKLSQHGNGLGLAIVKAICDFHHWKLNYQFAEGFHLFSITF